MQPSDFRVVDTFVERRHRDYSNRRLKCYVLRPSPALRECVRGPGLATKAALLQSLVPVGRVEAFQVVMDPVALRVLCSDPSFDEVPLGEQAPAEYL